jgi:serine/threonine-protein kinase
MNALLMAAAQRRYAPIDTYRPETPKRLRQILDRALALEPADRFQKAREMADQLEEWLASTGTRVKPSDLAALVTDPALISTDPAARPAPPVPLDDVPPTMVSEAETLRDVPAPAELRESKALLALRETVASRRPGSGPNLAHAGPVPDSSLDPTPVVGTPAVARRAVAVVTDVSLMPTDPVKSAPDIAAVMARPAKEPSRPELVAVTQPSLPNPLVPPPTGSPVPDPLKTALTAPANTTGTVPAPPAPKRPRRWPWVLLIVVLLPIGGVAFAIELLPKDSPVRARLIDVVAPLLQKLRR